jgi:predicted small secreted protein
VPDFGGFITQQMAATLNSETHTISPPSKKVAFNSHLKYTDGLLANYIASKKEISFEKASEIISVTVKKWQSDLKGSEIQLQKLGTLSLNKNHQIIFEPHKDINFLTASFGLATASVAPILRPASQVKPLIPIHKTAYKKGIPAFIKYAATAAIIISLSYAGFTGYEQKQQKETLISQQKDLEKKIQLATFIIANPLPTLKLNVVKKAKKQFHVVAGAFQFEKNAERKVQQLISNGFNAKIIGVNNWGLTQVVFNSYSDKSVAIQQLNKIRKTSSKDAWLLTKTLK